MNRFVILYFVFLLFRQYLCSDTLDSNLKNVDVDVDIDLTSHLSKVTTTIKLINEGHRSVDIFHYVIDPYLSGKLSFIGAKELDGDQEVAVLQIDTTQVNAPHTDAKYHRIKLSSPINPRTTVSVVVETVYSNAQSPLPKEILQDDRQLVKFIGNLYHFSPYQTISQVIVVNLASDKVESYSQIRPVNLNKDVITYGPFKDTPAYMKQKFALHFENHSPFLSTYNLNRWIEVSHWGNIAVEENLHIQHTGAKLKGSFSRYDFQRNPYAGSPSSIRSFKTLLPSSAKDVYYRDEIGNISTSHLLELSSVVEIEIRPRFPLFGGWQTRYTIGYNLPSYEYLFQQGSRYGLKMRFIDHIYDNQFVEEIRLSIVLPEGCSDIIFNAPYSTGNLTNGLHFTYLDTIGRPIIQVSKKNLVDNHIEDFTLLYSFNSLMLLQEPLLVFITLFSLYILVIFSVRLDFSIIEDKNALLKMHLGEAIVDYCSLIEKKLMLVNKFITAIEKFKTNKERTSFKNSKNQNEYERKLLSGKISQIEKECRFPPEISTKITEIGLKESKLRQNIEQTLSLFDKPGLKHVTINSQEELLAREREELILQIKALLATL